MLIKRSTPMITNASYLLPLARRGRPQLGYRSLTTVRLSLTDHSSAIAHRPQGLRLSPLGRGARRAGWVMPTAYCLNVYPLLGGVPGGRGGLCLLPTAFSPPTAFFPYSQTVIVTQPSHAKLARIGPRLLEKRSIGQLAPSTGESKPMSLVELHGVFPNENQPSSHPISCKIPR